MASSLSINESPDFKAQTNIQEDAERRQLCLPEVRFPLLHRIHFGGKKFLHYILATVAQGSVVRETLNSVRFLARQLRQVSCVVRRICERHGDGWREERRQRPVVVFDCDSTERKP